MPELPEVETTCQGIAPTILGRSISGWRLRQPRLRWPVVFPADLRGQPVVRVFRRAKYLLLETRDGAVIVHLGMSGSLRVVPIGTPAGRHDHVDLEFDDEFALRLTDPRRFGSMHYQRGDWRNHWLLKNLGVEPLTPEFDGDHLHRAARRRSVAVKQMLMDAHVVVGVGNIYANEALFHAGIRPRVAAGRISRARYDALAAAVREVLAAAIRDGGTTLRDFVDGSGRPGYFGRSLKVYGRDGEPCVDCGTTLKGLRTGQRATVYCPKCQQ
jgi:formamidopyrimidine-DNA glycosylase